jgi:membrane protein implicated in regulation of membrane protease activity
MPQPLKDEPPQALYKSPNLLAELLAYTLFFSAFGTIILSVGLLFLDRQEWWLGMLAGVVFLSLSMVAGRRVS